MIEYFLKETFPKHHGIDPAEVSIPITHKDKPFSEVDSKACDDAAKVQYNPDGNFNKFQEVCSICDKIVLNVNNNGQVVTVIGFEQYINGLPKKITDDNRCDLLMTDGESHNKIVFCDLCCYDEKYIGPNTGKHPEGKSGYARKQMEKSIEMFMNIDVLNTYILTYPNKVCLFAYRSYNAIQEPIAARKGANYVEINMRAMMVTPSSVSGCIETENKVMNHNFTFIQNKYPTIYNW